LVVIQGPKVGVHGVTRRQRNGLLERTLGFLRFIPSQVDNPEVAVSLGIVGSQLDDMLELRQGLCIAALTELKPAKIVISVPVVGAQGSGFLVGSLRFGDAASILIRASCTGEGICASRI
jgi:hypothetical protein